MIRRYRYFLGLLLWLALYARCTQAKPVSPEQALLAVQGWLCLDPQPLNTPLGPYILDVETYHDMNNAALFYVVHLAPSGYVIVGAEDRVEPIIAFSRHAAFDPSQSHPLGALVTSDLQERMAYLHATPQPSSRTMLFSVPKTETETDTQRKWRQLTDLSSLLKGRSLLSSFKAKQSVIPDIRVSPLIDTQWGQESVGHNLCFNYYPPSHTPCGCAATAMAQLMYLHQHPQDGVGSHAFEIKVYDQQQTAYTRGGDGDGGPYDWDNMVLCPSADTSTISRQAIGALCYDAGISIDMEYADDGSGADGLTIAGALINTFGYSSAVTGHNHDDNISPPNNLLNMINPNLDAGYPIILGIFEDDTGHAVIADGYGYSESTLYHHLNMGYQGYDDVWYNLPSINAYDEILVCVYNIFVQDRGEIISGRILGPGQRPLKDVLVTAHSKGGDFTATTNPLGIYALPHVPSRNTYDLSASKPGYVCDETTVYVGYSRDSYPVTGNRWGNDLRFYFTGDYDQDDDVDFYDFAVFAWYWRQAGDYIDLLSFSENWLIQMEPATE